MLLHAEIHERPQRLVHRRVFRIRDDAHDACGALPLDAYGLADRVQPRPEPFGHPLVDHDDFRAGLDVRGVERAARDEGNAERREVVRVHDRIADLDGAFAVRGGARVEFDAIAAPTLIAERGRDGERHRVHLTDLREAIAELPIHHAAARRRVAVGP